eukprot:UN33383
MHQILDFAHLLHHKRPTEIKIIATPLVAVQISFYPLMLILNALIGIKLTVQWQIGISISQFLMDLVHVLGHSQVDGWWIRSCRSFHLLHHKTGNHSLGYGFTCTFWDCVFGTLPHIGTCKKHEDAQIWQVYKD